MSSGGWLFKQTGWLHPAGLAQCLLADARQWSERHGQAFTMHLGQSVNRIEPAQGTTPPTAIGWCMPTTPGLGPQRGADQRQCVERLGRPAKPLRWSPCPVSYSRANHHPEPIGQSSMPVAPNCQWRQRLCLRHCLTDGCCVAPPPSTTMHAPPCAKPTTDNSGAKLSNCWHQLADGWTAGGVFHRYTWGRVAGGHLQFDRLPSGGCPPALRLPGIPAPGVPARLRQTKTRTSHHAANDTGGFVCFTGGLLAWHHWVGSGWPLAGALDQPARLCPATS